MNGGIKSQRSNIIHPNLEFGSMPKAIFLLLFILSIKSTNTEKILNDEEAEI